MPTPSHRLVLLACGVTMGTLALFEQFEALLPALVATGAATWILRPLPGQHDAAGAPGNGADGPPEGGGGSRVSEPR